MRYQHASDLRADLKREQRDSGSGRSATREVLQSLGAEEPPLSPAGTPRRRWPASLGAAVSLAALGALGWWFLSSQSPEGPSGPQEITPFTTDGGNKANPELSLDGEKVAYEWRGDIYVKALGPGTTPFRLTKHEAYETHPVWSPDGRQIAFVRKFESGAALYTVPALGGQERKLIDLRGRLGPSGASTLPALSWSPDGGWLAFSEKSPEKETFRIVRLSLATLEKQPLTSPAESSRGDWDPAFSPDGTLLAFVRSGPEGWGDLDVWVQPVEGGEARRLTSQGYNVCKAPTWTPDGGEILFTVRGEGIRRVSVEDGEPEPILGVGQNAAFPSLRGNRMVFQQMTSQPFDLWRTPGRRGPNPDRAPERLIASSTLDANADYSPDGRRIAFCSSRGGVSAVWTCDSDGTNPVQLTSFERGGGTPRWSPDGRRIVFDSDEAGDNNLYVIDADGGVPRRLTPQPSSDTMGTWSRDGRWIYFRSDRSGTEQIWKIPVQGGEAVQVTTGGGYYALESWDGRDVYYTKTGSPMSIWRVPASGGEETEVLPVPGSPGRGLAVFRSGLYYSQMTQGQYHWQDALGESEYMINFLDFESGQVTTLFKEEGFIPWADLAVSPDEEWILYGKHPVPVSELMLMENFR